jgi:hypothetical protein
MEPRRTLTARGKSHSGCERAERQIPSSAQLARIAADTASSHFLGLCLSAHPRSPKHFHHELLRAESMRRGSAARRQQRRRNGIEFLGHLTHSTQRIATAAGPILPIPIRGRARYHTAQTGRLAVMTARRAGAHSGIDALNGHRRSASALEVPWAPSQFRNRRGGAERGQRAGRPRSVDVLQLEAFRRRRPVILCIVWQRGYT